MDLRLTIRLLLFFLLSQFCALNLLRAQTTDSFFEVISQEAISGRSYFPQSAFVTDRLIPFLITGDTFAALKEIRVAQGSSCESVIDPFYAQVFHVSCPADGALLIEVVYLTTSGQDASLYLGPYQVLSESEPVESASHE